ncbi:MAG: TM2 domain-containing protein [Gemmatimonadales bacterium]|nr:TM2 domain-containing protein [Gemmatimonadales bacterium]
MESGSSDKSRGVALALAAVLGVFGGHRFYAGKTGTGILMAATLGGAGLWYLYDLILVASGGFRDSHGRRITRWDPEFELEPPVATDVLEELYALRTEVAELAERLDFTERLLAAPRQTEPARGAGPDRDRMP